MTERHPGALSDGAGKLARNEQPDRATPDSWLTHRDIREFQTLMRQCCGVEMDDAIAWKRAIQLVSLIRMLIGPLPEDPEVQRQALLAERPVDM